MIRLARNLCLAGALAFVLMFLLAQSAAADTEFTTLFWYGAETDGHLGAPTAFADRWDRPTWLWRTVRDDRPGIALCGYEPGAAVRITVVGTPGWTKSWPELDGLAGRSTVAYVADRPGECWYADAWSWTFGRLAPLWIGRLFVKIEKLGR